MLTFSEPNQSVLHKLLFLIPTQLRLFVSKTLPYQQPQKPQYLFSNLEIIVLTIVSIQDDNVLCYKLDHVFVSLVENINEI